MAGHHDDYECDDDQLVEQKDQDQNHYNEEKSAHAEFGAVRASEGGWGEQRPAPANEIFLVFFLDIFTFFCFQIGHFNMSTLF